MNQKIFVTGASGCIGHYIIEQLINRPATELHLLLRNPARLLFDYKSYPNLHIHIGNLEKIEAQEQTIKNMDYLIHIATDWSNSDYAHLLNVVKTHKMFDYCAKGNCRRILYFSTASILGKDNTLLPEAGQLGTGYIKSKYMAYKLLKESPAKDIIHTLFPTLVFGGDKNHPYSHLSGGIIPNLHYAKILRFLYLNSRFHFMHATDIAGIACKMLSMPNPPKEAVLGGRMITGKEAIEILCRVFHIRKYVRVKITPWLLKGLLYLFKIKLDPWDRYCLYHPFFEYKTITPKNVSLPYHYPELESILDEIKAQHLTKL
ncbi:NAD-dependent epimerase/dehydratase family protein [Thermoproteota archaeon]